MGTKERRVASRDNRIGMMIIGLAVLALIVVLVWQSNGLRVKMNDYQEANKYLQEQIQAERERSKEIEKLPSYVASDEYIEKVAREKFGLVYENEVLFKTED